MNNAQKVYTLMTMSSSPDNEVILLALQEAPSGIMVAGSQGEIQYVNQTLGDMFGYREEELLGKPVEILIQDQLAVSHRRHVENYIHNPQLRAMGTGRDLEGTRKDGQRFPVEIGLRPAQTSTGPVVVATIIDISQRKAIEDRLHQHEEQLEELVEERTRELLNAQREKDRVLEHLIQTEKMAVVGTLVSGIGHEINNPLYVLFAAAEALSEENSVDQCQAYGKEILKQARHIRETVKNLSLYVQPGSRHDLQCVNLKATIHEAVHLARRTLQGNQIDFDISTIPTLEIHAKSEEIQQILFNIVRNAMQAIDGGGQISIQMRQDDSWVEIHIEDNGEGIPEDIMKRVFDPFFTTKGPDEGEGLGLYIVRQIVTRYRGTIDVERAAKGGTRFVLRFPIAERKTTEEEKL